MSVSVGAYEAKTHLASLLDRVADGETITITRHGVPVAVLTPPPGASNVDVEEAIRTLRALRAARAGRGFTADELRAMREEGRR